MDFRGEAWDEIRTMMDYILEGLVIVDADGIIRTMNKAAGSLIRVKPEEALGRHVRQVIPNTRLHIVIKNGRAELNQRQIIGERTIITNRVPAYDKQGNLLGAIAVFRDNSEVVRLAEEITSLRETQGLLESIINSTQDAISVVDENGSGILINPAYTRLTGLVAEDVLGKPATVDIAEGESVHMRVLNTRQPIKGVSMKVGPARKPVLVDAAPILVGDDLKGSVAVIHDVSEIHRLSEALEQAHSLIRRLEAKYSFKDIVGDSREIKAALQQARKAAGTPATVILRGESGTGKELFAHAIHEASGRQGQFIRVSCAAIADSLLESELFGYVEGAFTGANRQGRKGYFEAASGGTLFLDEVGEVSLGLQAKLLRVLQEREIVRVGDSRPVSVDTRVIAATNKNLEEEVRKGNFRQDLYYRLNVIPIYIPPLRSRKGDIPVLARFLLRKLNQEYGRNISRLAPESLEILLTYDWPGNVRELENVLGRAVINMRIADTIVLPEHLPPLGFSQDGAGSRSFIPAAVHQRWPDKTFMEMRAEWEEQVVKAALEKTGGNRTQAARLLGISLRTLYNKIKE